MNIQLANVISNISGVTGQADHPESDPGWGTRSRELAAYRDRRIQASEEEIAQALGGNWQEDQVFLLRRNRRDTSFAKTDDGVPSPLAQDLAQLEDWSQGATLPEETRKERRRKKKAHPQFNVREGLFRMTGADLTQIDSIDVVTANTVISEVGWDMSKWKTENHFVSWLKRSSCPQTIRSVVAKSLGKVACPPTTAPLPP